MTATRLGKILEVDLGQGRLSEVEPDPLELRSFIGGSGYGACLMARQLPQPPGPLEPGNPLMFLAGPLTGTPVPTAGRHTIVSRSPLTGLWGEASIGGSWGRELRRAGYLGVVIRGRADRPVYLYLSPQGAELRDAAHLWGLHCQESDRALRGETEAKAVVATIGPAGENLVPLAGIFSDGRHARTAARGGLGAVAGSKNLKAVVVRGQGRVPVADASALKQVTREMAGSYQRLAQALGPYGTPHLVHPCAEIGTMPFQNWRKGAWKRVGAITGQRLKERFQVGRYHCAGCPVGCGRVVEIDREQMAGPEYETLGILGGACLIDDLEGLCRLNRLCNQLGLDTIEAGSLVAFAMELYERGVITREDTGGLELTWGDWRAAGELIRQIGYKEGLGAFLGQGLAGAARELGGVAPECAVQVKGMAAAAHDPRAYFSIALGYATSNRGACHLQAFSHIFERNLSMPEWGLDEPLERFAVEGKAELVMRAQDLMALFDALALCKFSLFAGVGPAVLSQWLNAVCGWDMEPAELSLCGERIFNLKRIYNNSLGITRKDDSLPGRLLTHKRGEGGTVKSLPPLNIMLSEYYELRGWDQEGIPRSDKLGELGLGAWDEKLALPRAKGDGRSD